MIIGPISSIYDFLTFAVLLWMFHASTNAPLFHTGWFVESLATQTLVVFVIRTAGNPLKSHPSRPLLVAVFAIVAVAAVLPYTGLGKLLQFTPLPLSLLGCHCFPGRYVPLAGTSRQVLVLSPARVAMTVGRRSYLVASSAGAFAGCLAVVLSCARGLKSLRRGFARTCSNFRNNACSAMGRGGNDAGDDCRCVIDLCFWDLAQALTGACSTHYWSWPWWLSSST